MAKEKKKLDRRKNVGFKLNKKFSNAFRGILVAFKEESTLIYYLIITIMVIALGLWINLSLISWAILLLTFGVLFGIELLNTAIENFVDLLNFEYNIQSKKIKDICAAASVLNSIFATIIGICIFIQPLIDKIELLIR